MMDDDRTDNGTGRGKEGSARPFRVTVAPRGWEFDAPPGRSLLMAAGQGGVLLPSSCRNGTCRTCLCQLERGQVAYLIEWPGLSAEEKRAGTILPCVAVALSDLEITVPFATRLATPSAGA